MDCLAAVRSSQLRPFTRPIIFTMISYLTAFFFYYYNLAPPLAQLFFFSLSLLSSCWLSILPLKSNPAPSLMDNDIALIILNIDCSRVWQTGSWHPVSALSTIQFQPSQWILFKWSSRIARPITLFWCIYHRPFGGGGVTGTLCSESSGWSWIMCSCVFVVVLSKPPRRHVPYFIKS